MLELRPAKPRGYIERGGFYPNATYQLSVSPHPDLLLPDLKTVPLTQIAPVLERMWQNLIRQRQEEAGIVTYSREVYPFPFEPLSPVVFAPTTERLFKEAAVPAIKEYCQWKGKDYLVVEEAGYLFPFWSQEELAPVEIMEGPLQEFIKENGKFPDTVGVVYLDFPSSVHTSVTGSEVVKFIRNNPSVLFIVDQANLYFSDMGASIRDDLMLVGEGKLTDNDLVLVTNTTTKAMGMAGSAVIAATDRAKDLLEPALRNEFPQALGFDDKSFLLARQLLASETQPELGDEGSVSEITAFNYRRLIAQNREKLKASLQEKFEEAALSPELHTAGPHIFINAGVFGFRNAQEMCDALSERFSIATKPVSVYTDSERHPQYNKYVYMAVPWNDEIMQAVLKAFEALKIASRA